VKSPAVSSNKVAAASLPDRSLFFLTALAYLLLVFGAGPIAMVLVNLPTGSILGQLAAKNTVSAMYGWFVLLPATVAFVGIGLPALFGLIRGLLGSSTAALPTIVALAAIALALAAMFLASGIVAVVVVILTVIVVLKVLGGEEIAVARVFTGRLALGAFCGLIGMLWFEAVVINGQDPGFAIAPTMVLLAYVFGYLSVLASIAGLGVQEPKRYGPGSPDRVLAMALVSWVSWPFAALVGGGRGFFEIGATGVSAAIALALAFVGRKKT